MGVEEEGGSMCIGWDGKMLSVDVGGLIAKLSAIRWVIYVMCRNGLVITTQVYKYVSGRVLTIDKKGERKGFKEDL